MAYNWEIQNNATYKYIAPWGNDVTGDGTMENPFKTPVQGVKNSIAHQNFTAYTFTSLLSSGDIIFGDGVVTFDGKFNSYFAQGGLQGGVVFENIGIKNYQSLTNPNNSNTAVFRNCLISNINNLITSVGYNFSYQNCLIKNCNIYLPTGGTAPNLIKNNTFIDCQINLLTYSVKSLYDSLLFYKCELNFGKDFNFENCLFDPTCSFKFTGGGLGNDETTYTVASGATAEDKLNDLRNRCVTVFGGNVLDYFKDCQITDPLFTDPTNEDYTLQSGSPALTLSNTGSYVGKYGLGLAWKFRATEANGDWLNSAATNLDVADDSLTLTDYDLTGEIEGLAKSLGGYVELEGLPVIGDTAVKNGEALGSATDLAASTISAGTAIVIGSHYRVEEAPIIHDSILFAVGDTFKATTTSFTTVTTGVLREVIILPYKPSIGWRFSNGKGDELATGNSLTVGNWYVVSGNTVTYNAVTYNIGDLILCVTGVTAFTGSGILETVFASGDTYYQFVPGYKPTINTSGDVITGTILRGNAEGEFDYANELAVYAKYAQPKITIQVDNLS